MRDVALAHGLGELDLLIRGEQRHLADLLEVHADVVLDVDVVGDREVEVLDADVLLVVLDHLELFLVHLVVLVHRGLEHLDVVLLEHRNDLVILLVLELQVDERVDHGLVFQDVFLLVGELDQVLVAPREVLPLLLVEAVESLRLVVLVLVGAGALFRRAIRGGLFLLHGLFLNGGLLLLRGLLRRFRLLLFRQFFFRRGSLFRSRGLFGRALLRRGLLLRGRALLRLFRFFCLLLCGGLRLLRLLRLLRSLFRLRSGDDLLAHQQFRILFLLRILFCSHF